MMKPYTSKAHKALVQQVKAAVVGKKMPGSAYDPPIQYVLAYFGLFCFSLGLPGSVQNAAYGIGWARETCRLSGEIEMRWLRKMTKTEVIKLICEVALECPHQAVVPGYMSKKYYGS